MRSVKNGCFAAQSQKETRGVALVPILKAHVMSTISERVLHSNMPGYRAGEIRSGQLRSSQTTGEGCTERREGEGDDARSGPSRARPAPPRSHHYGEGQTQRTITQDEQDRLARSRHPASEAATHRSLPRSNIPNKAAEGAELLDVPEGMTKTVALPAGVAVELTATSSPGVLGSHRWVVDVCVDTWEPEKRETKLHYSSAVGRDEPQQRIEIPRQEVDCILRISAVHCTGGDWEPDEPYVAVNHGGRVAIGFGAPNVTAAGPDAMVLAFHFET